LCYVPKKMEDILNIYYKEDYKYVIINVISIKSYQYYININKAQSANNVFKNILKIFLKHFQKR